MRILREGTKAWKDELSRCAGRGYTSSKEVREIVAQIIELVRVRGDDALFELTKKFDRFDPAKEGFVIGREKMEEAFDRLPPSVRKVLLRMAERIEDFHSRQLERNLVVFNDAGASLSLMVAPVEKAGIYAPGGKAAYPSTVLMNGIPAKVAGVKEVYAAVPTPEGVVRDEVLAACFLAGVEKLFRVGGAQAIAAFAFGTETVPRVDVIAGPGNQFVTEAKKQLFGLVGIDMLAGPSELVVIADSSADPHLAAYDLVSQAEHGEDAFVSLVTDSEEVARNVAAQVDEIASREKRKEILARSLENAPAFVCRSMERAVEVVNLLAPEHLSVQTEEPVRYLPLLKNAGTIFIGPWSPVAVGDYIAGINHTLPTGGSARFFSPLGVYHFLKRYNVVHYGRESLREDVQDVARIAKREGLSAHGNAAAARFRKKEGGGG
ncbi:MAG: histidinol dehydrogenase [Deltaproteobacteria bacterium]|nr:MAG: histidinol dehydrogenase [Deltaproteobacteria bacterium]